MGKNLIIAALGIAVLGLGYYVFEVSDYGAPGTGTPQHQTTTPANDDTEVCAQVITSARDPQTGYIKQFPTPCDVPEGWVVIQNDIPGFDVQPQ